MKLENIDKTFKEHFFADPVVHDQLLYFISSAKKCRTTAAKKILCLHGVSGSGKATMLRGLCRALDWRLVTIKLGEVTSDDGQVLGAFRTDLNATAARVVHALDGLKGENVALLLEDLDKMNPPELHNNTINFFQVLEQMQQYALQNHYKKEQIDLSEVVFFATAKNLSLVPSGLRRQLQILRIPSYSERDKVNIVRNYILPQIEDDYQLKDKVAFSPNAIVRLIREYTREGGVGQAKRELETIGKKLYIHFDGDSSAGFEKINKNHLEKYLGPPRFPPEKDRMEDRVGTVSLLGKSEQGGCILVLEALALQGKGQTLITGNADRLFQESAMVAVNYLRTCALKYHIDENFFNTVDLHLHVQYGQIPKFGVSAGAGIITAVVSALSGRPVKPNLGITGEISLKGKILGVQDIRDKVLGACQEGLSHIFVPKENNREVHSLSKDIKKCVEISLVDHVEELLDAVIIW